MTKPQKQSTRGASRDWIKRLLLFIMAPLGFLLAFEGGLALSGAVEPMRLLNQVDHDGERFWTTNPLYGRAIFRRDGAPMPAQLWVPVQKSDQERRVVLLGESAAHGFPLNIYNLARVTEASWNVAYPDQPVRVIGLTMTGINSHILRLFLREAMQLQPDLILLYAGHNEVIGPFGPAAVFGRYQPQLWWIRAKLWLQRRYIAQAIRQWGDRLVATKAIPTWRGLGEFEQAQIADDDPVLITMRSHAERNLRDMLDLASRRQVPLLLSVPAVNLNDWPPMGSLPAQLTDEEALARVRQGHVQSLRSAWQVYRLARIYERRGDRETAGRLFRHARDLDLYRFRFDSGLEEIWYRLANAFADRGVWLVDTDRALHDDPGGPLGDRYLFVEHVHLTVEGRLRVAIALVEGMARAWGLPAVPPPDQDRVLQDLFYTILHEYDLWSKTLSLLRSPPFPQQPEYEARVAFIQGVVEESLQRFHEEWPFDRIDHAYQQALRRRPHDPAIHVTAGRLFSEARHWVSAEAALRRALHQQPQLADALFNLVRLTLERGDPEEALVMTARLKQFAPADAELWALEGQAEWLRGNLDRSAEAFQQALRLKPDDPMSLLGLALCEDLRGRKSEAIHLLRRYIELAPADSGVQATLSWILLTLPEPTAEDLHEGYLLAQRAHEAEPDELQPQAALALALAARGEIAPAVRYARTVLHEAATVGAQEMAEGLRDGLRRYGVEIE
jgi:tetratricopeptide (TPR) repeat protein